MSTGVNFDVWHSTPTRKRLRDRADGWSAIVDELKTPTQPTDRPIRGSFPLLQLSPQLRNNLYTVLTEPLSGQGSGSNPYRHCIFIPQSRRLTYDVRFVDVELEPLWRAYVALAQSNATVRREFTPVLCQASHLQLSINTLPRLTTPLSLSALRNGSFRGSFLDASGLDSPHTDLNFRRSQAFYKDNVRVIGQILPFFTGLTDFSLYVKYLVRQWGFPHDANTQYVERLHNPLKMVDTAVRRLPEVKNMWIYMEVHAFRRGTALFRTATGPQFPLHSSSEDYVYIHTNALNRPFKPDEEDNDLIACDAPHLTQAFYDNRLVCDWVHGQSRLGEWEEFPLRWTCEFCNARSLTRGHGDICSHIIRGDIPLQ